MTTSKIVLDSRRGGNYNAGFPLILFPKIVVAIPFCETKKTEEEREEERQPRRILERRETAAFDSRCYGGSETGRWGSSRAIGGGRERLLGPIGAKISMDPCLIKRPLASKISHRFFQSRNTIGRNIVQKNSSDAASLCKRFLETNFGGRGCGRGEDATTTTDPSFLDGYFAYKDRVFGKGGETGEGLGGLPSFPGGESRGKTPYWTTNPEESYAFLNIDNGDSYDEEDGREDSPKVTGCGEETFESRGWKVEFYFMSFNAACYELVGVRDFVSSESVRYDFEEVGGEVDRFCMSQHELEEKYGPTARKKTDYESYEKRGIAGAGDSRYGGDPLETLKRNKSTLVKLASIFRDLSDVAVELFDCDHPSSDVSGWGACTNYWAFCKFASETLAYVQLLHMDVRNYVSGVVKDMEDKFDYGSFKAAALLWHYHEKVHTPAVIEFVLEQRKREVVERGEKRRGETTSPTSAIESVKKSRKEENEEEIRHKKRRTRWEEYWSFVSDLTYVIVMELHSSLICKRITSEWALSGAATMLQTYLVYLYMIEKKKGRRKFLRAREDAIPACGEVLQAFSNHSHLVKVRSKELRKYNDEVSRCEIKTDHRGNPKQWLREEIKKTLSKVNAESVLQGGTKGKVESFCEQISAVKHRDQKEGGSVALPRSKVTAPIEYKDKYDSILSFLKYDARAARSYVRWVEAKGDDATSADIEVSCALTSFRRI